MIHSRIKIIPSAPPSSAAAASSNATTNSGSHPLDLHYLCVQFALHGLTPRQQATPAARTIFFCIASQQLFPNDKALSLVCADPIDFTRICAKHGRGAEVPRPDFVSGYTKALPVAQYGSGGSEQQQDHSKPLQKEGEEGGGGDAGTNRRQRRDKNSPENSSSKQQQQMMPRWVFVAEARVCVSEHMMASLMGETNQRFVVLYTSACFQRKTGAGGDDGSESALRCPSSIPQAMGAGGRNMLPKFSGEALAQPLMMLPAQKSGRSGSAKSRPSSSSNTGRRRSSVQQKPEWTTLMHSPGSRHGPASHDGGASENGILQVATCLSRDECVSMLELSSDLLASDLGVSLGPHDRSWLFRFSASGKRRWKHASFNAARQLCSHRMHLGNAAMLREMAQRFNKFLVGATQDTRRFCSFRAARMQVPIVFGLGMRSPQCQVFLQFLRESRRYVLEQCVPEVPPHLVSHVVPPEFINEKPLLEVIADLSLRFFTGYEKKRGVASTSPDQQQPPPPHRRSSVVLDSNVSFISASAASDENNQHPGSFHQRHSSETTVASAEGYNKFVVGGTYGPEARSVFSPWRIEWLDYLLLSCVEVKLWREIAQLLEAFFELTDQQLLKHPEYLQEEHLLRINLFANVDDIVKATGHGLQMDEAVQVAARCAHYCKASPANRALVLRIRHMTRVPYFQRILFDPTLCMFEELCPSAAKATVGRILWCVLVPLAVQKKVTAVIGARDNGVPMITTPMVAARQFRAFVHATSIGDDAMKVLMKRLFVEWVNLIRCRRQRKKNEMALQMTVRQSMVKNMDSRKAFFIRWRDGTLKRMKERNKKKFM